MRECLALLDLDGTTADYDAALFAGLEKLHGPSEIWGETIRKIHQYPRAEWIQNRIDLIRSVPGWWLNLKELSSGMEVYRMLLELKFGINVLTKGPDPEAIPNAWQEKAQWSRIHLPGARVTVCDEKDNVYGRVLVDDYPKYAEGWLKFRPRGLVIMPVNPRNTDFEHPQVIKYNGDNKGQVFAALKLARDRKGREPLDLSDIRKFDVLLNG